MAAQPQPYLTAEQYLALERNSEEKHEYCAGAIYAMAGGSARRNRIAGNAFASLHNQLRQRDCSVYPSDMRVKVVQTGLYSYPDITVVCGHEQFEDDHEDTLLNPIVIIEVLSPSTEKYDRGKKFQNYRAMLSLREYLLIAQDEYRVEHYVRQPDNQWLLSEATSLDTQVEVAAIECALALRDVYARVRLSGAPTDEQGST